jgi:hypothetical protein
MPLDILSQLSFMETYLPAALLLWGSMVAWLLALYLMQRKEGFRLEKMSPSPIRSTNAINNKIILNQRFLLNQKL